MSGPHTCAAITPAARNTGTDSLMTPFPRALPGAPCSVAVWTSHVLENLLGQRGALPWCSQGAPWEAQVARALSPGDCESVFGHLLRDGPQASRSFGQGEGLSQVPSVFTSPSP